MPLVAEVVHVAVGDHVQAGSDFHDFDLVSAVHHGGELGVGAHVIRAGVYPGQQLLLGVFAGLAGCAQLEQFPAKQSSRTRFQGQAVFRTIKHRAKQAVLIHAQPRPIRLAVDPAYHPGRTRLNLGILRGPI